MFLVPFFVPHFFRIAMVASNDEDAIPFFYKGFIEFFDLVIKALDCFDGCLFIAGVSYHVSVCVVDEIKVTRVLFE